MFQFNRPYIFKIDKDYFTFESDGKSTIDFVLLNMPTLLSIILFLQNTQKLSIQALKTEQIQPEEGTLMSL